MAAELPEELGADGSGEPAGETGDESSEFVEDVVEAEVLEDTTDDEAARPLDEPTEVRSGRGIRILLTLVGVACLLGAIPTAALGLVAWATADLVESWLASSEPEAGTDRKAHWEERLRSGRWDEVEFGTEAATRLPIREYAGRPPWSAFRTTGLLRFLGSLLVFISAIGVFRGRERWRRMLVAACLLLAVLACVEALSLDTHYRAAFADGWRDLMTARADLNEDSGRAIAQQPPMPEPDELRVAASVYFLILSGPWQLAALLAVFLIPLPNPDPSIGTTPA